MVFGYTPLDPLVVLWGTFLASWYLSRDAIKLIGFLPTALSLWFFVPSVTNLTLWQTVPLLLTGRMLAQGGLRLPSFAQPVMIAVALFFLLSGCIAMLAGTDGTRAMIRVLYYLGAFATLGFAYEMGRRPEAYEILLKGFIVMGIVYAGYGAYQIVAFYAGLPVRGIVYNASGKGIMAFENGLLRINSFANEPKRLGYVLFLSAAACIFLANARRQRRAQQLRWSAVGILLMSFLTFAGSYYIAIALFCLGALLLYPSRAAAYVLLAIAFAASISMLFPDLGVLDAIQNGYNRRTAEIEVGLDGAIVYRQELFAWDYLAKNPMSALGGVGIGQYYSVLNSAYGAGVGYDQYGGLMPLNSNFLELTFDVGIVAAGAIYGSLIWLIYKLRRAREHFFLIGLLFLVVQSLTILNLSYIMLFAGIAMGRLTLKREEVSERKRPAAST